MITEPKVEMRAEQPYVAIRARVTMAEMGPTLPPLWGEVFGWLAQRGIAPAGAPFWNYRVIDMENQLEIDVAVPVAAAVAGDGRVVAGTLPAGRYVTMSYFGPYEGDGLMRATGDLLAWADAHGLIWDKWPVGSSGEGWKARVEHYITDPQTEPDSSKWETALAFKLAD